MIKPFRDRVETIELVHDGYHKVFVYFDLDGARDSFSLPSFREGTMYKGMEIERKYTLEELGL